MVERFNVVPRVAKLKSSHSFLAITTKLACSNPRLRKFDIAVRTPEKNKIPLFFKN